MSATAPSIVHGLSFSDYLLDGAINASSLVEMAKSPKHYAHGLRHRRGDTAALRLGRAAHTLVLEPERFADSYAVSPFDSFRTNEAKAWRAAQEAARRTVLTAEQLDEARAVAAAVHAAPEAMEWLREGQAEVTLRWTDSITGLKCKGRADWIGRALVDLKTTRDVMVRRFEAQSADLHYHLKLAWYRDAIQAITGKRLPVVIVAVETEPPHDVVVFEVPEDVLEVGRAAYSALLDRVAICRETNNWPGISGGQVLRLRLPRWADPSNS